MSEQVLTEEELTAFSDLRRKVFAGIERELKEGGNYGKPYEGRMAIVFPDYSGGSAFSLIHRLAPWTIQLSCYVLGDGRHYSWEGKTFRECLDQAEASVDQWLIEAEANR